MPNKIRTVEISSTEVYVDVNDLIIELLVELDNSSSEQEKKILRSLVNRLTDIRNKGHKH